MSANRKETACILRGTTRMVQQPSREGQVEASRCWQGSLEPFLAVPGRHHRRRVRVGHSSHRIHQLGVARHETGRLLGKRELVAKLAHPAILVHRERLGVELTLWEGLGECVRGDLATLERELDALASEGIDEAGDVADDEQVVVETL